MDRTVPPLSLIRHAAGPILFLGFFGTVFAWALSGEGTCHGTPVDPATIPLAFTLADAVARDAAASLTPALAAATALVLAALAAAWFGRRAPTGVTLRTSR